MEGTEINYDPFEDPESDYYEDPEIQDDYDSLHKKLVSYLTNGEVHSTLVGIMITLNGDQGKKDVIEATRFADYIVNLLKKID